MTDYMEAASAVLASAQHRVETAAQNIANMNTPGYRRRVSFEQALAAAGGTGLPSAVSSTDFGQGKPVNTGAPLDLAISGRGFLVVRNGEEALYTRNGQLKLDEDGRLVTEAGLPVQLQSGGDVRLKSAAVKVLADGSIIEDGDLVGRLALVDFLDPKAAMPVDGGFRSPAQNTVDAKGSTVAQGVLESSNIALGEEMVSIMQALRSAEAGQRLVNVYDDLLGRAISTFGQAT